MIQSGADVMVIGAATLDIKGRLLSEMIAETSNPGTVSISVGGVARNIAENLARLGLSTALIAAVGDDAFGQAIVSRTLAAGVDTTRVMTVARHSAAYLALLGSDGHLVTAIDDSHTAELLPPAEIERHAADFERARVVIFDANLAPESAERLLQICTAAGVPVGFDPVSFGLAERFRGRLAGLFLVTPNAIEAQALTGLEVRGIPAATRAAQQLVAEGVTIAIVTLARAGLVYATTDQHGYIPAIPCEVVDATGAGDALVAATVYGLLQRLPVDEAVRLGVSAATLTLLSAETVRRDLSLESLYAQLVI
jgi:pseudouridine kinase